MDLSVDLSCITDVFALQWEDMNNTATNNNSENQDIETQADASTAQNQQVAPSQGVVQGEQVGVAHIPNTNTIMPRNTSTAMSDLYSVDSYFGDMPETQGGSASFEGYSVVQTVRTISSAFANRVRSSNGQLPVPGLAETNSEESDSSANDTDSTTGSDSDEATEPNPIAASDIEEYRPSPVKSSKKDCSRPRKFNWDNDGSDMPDEEGHIGIFAHGKFWTVIGILFSWVGVALAVMARQSVEFVTLEFPFYIDPTFETVTEIGLMRLRLCFNETYDEDQSGCVNHPLASADIDDRMFELARALITLAILLGFFLSIFLTVAVFWNSINLRPIGIGYLIAYFMQSASFLFFDTTLCGEHKCLVGTGCYFSIAGSICWIISCVASSRMDHCKHKRWQASHKAKRRAKRILQEEQSRIIGHHGPSKKGSSSSPSSSSRRHHDSRGPSDSPDKQSQQQRINKKYLEKETSNSTQETVQSDFDEGIQDEQASQAWKALLAKRTASPFKQNASSGKKVKVDIAGPTSSWTDLAKSPTRQGEDKISFQAEVPPPLPSQINVVLLDAGASTVSRITSSSTSQKKNYPKSDSQAELTPPPPGRNSAVVREAGAASSSRKAKLDLQAEAKRVASPSKQKSSSLRKIKMDKAEPPSSWGDFATSPTRKDGDKLYLQVEVPPPVPQIKVVELDASASQASRKKSTMKSPRKSSSKLDSQAEVPPQAPQMNVVELAASASPASKKSSAKLDSQAELPPPASRMKVVGEDSSATRKQSPTKSPKKAIPSWSVLMPPTNRLGQVVPVPRNDQAVRA
jgi:hypothetical protein